MRLVGLALALLAGRCAAQRENHGDNPSLGTEPALHVANAAKASAAPRAKKISGSPSGTYSRSAPLAFNYTSTKARTPPVHAFD